MNIPFNASPNYRSGRRKPISVIVIHYTGSYSMEGCISWFKRKEAAVSAHYVIGRDGAIVQMVRDEDVAWHAGRSAMGPNEKPPREPDVNAFSIGIELVGTMDSGFTDRQLATLYELIAQLVVKYRIPPERVVGHLHIAPGRKIDPDGVDAQFPWPKTRMVAQAAYGSVLKAGARQA
jgi:N-acetylmuramoyl-L-alanine amidase